MNDRYSWFIQKNYDVIKETLKRCYNNCFSEDVFHQTLINCEKICLNNEKCTDNEIMNYIFVAFRTNSLREGIYSNNFRNDSLDVSDVKEEPFYSPVEDMIDIKIIYADLTSTFGKKLTDLFCIWLLKNKSVKKIENEHNLKGLQYRFKKMRNYILKKYPHDNGFNPTEPPFIA